MKTRADELSEMKRKPRTPMGQRNVLTIKGLTDDPNYHGHWFKDVGVRLQEALNAGYEFVPNNGVSVGDATVDTARSTDTLLSIPSKDRDGSKLYYMRIPIEFYKEDQLAKQARIDELEATMKSSNRDGITSNFQIDRKLGA